MISLCGMTADCRGGNHSRVKLERGETEHLTHSGETVTIWEKQTEGKERLCPAVSNP